MNLFIQNGIVLKFTNVSKEKMPACGNNASFFHLVFSKEE